jgi:hypothetical protein
MKSWAARVSMSRSLRTEPAGVDGEDEGERHVGLPVEVGDFLRDAVFGEVEVVLLEAADGSASRVGDVDEDVHEANFYVIGRGVGVGRFLRDCGRTEGEQRGENRGVVREGFQRARSSLRGFTVLGLAFFAAGFFESGVAAGLCGFAE